MKYRTKLYLGLISIAFLTAVLGLAITYYHTSKLVPKLLRDRVVSLSSTTASLLDPKLVEAVLSEHGKKTEQQTTLLHDLQRVQKANRDPEFHVSSIYLFTRAPQNPDQIMFILDAEENPSDAAQYGQIDSQNKQSHVLEHLYQPYSPPIFIKDMWGYWLSGFAPIYSTDGQYLASVGVDISMRFVHERIHEFLNYMLWGLFGSFILAWSAAYFLSKQVTKSLSIIHSSVKTIGEGNLEQETHLSTHDEFSNLAEAINTMVKGLKERVRLKSNFARYVSEQVLEKILSIDGLKALASEKKKITVLFSDIRQFNSLTENLPPEDVVKLLNEYFDAMIQIIFSYHGTLNKFIGDGLMVEFGAPLEDLNQELHAVQTALNMEKKVEELRTKWKREGKPEIYISIGIHTGLAIVGNVGSEKRMEYTAIGDTVNVASRLEKAAQELQATIVISEEVHKAIQDKFPCKSLGYINLRGRTEKTEVYTI